MPATVSWRYEPGLGYWIEMGSGPLDGLVDEILLAIPATLATDLDVQTITDALNQISLRLA